MPAASTTPDPRSVITPEAFRVSPELLGLQLASPLRRLAAILVDLVCIGVLTLVTRNFAVVLGLVISFALIRGSARRLKVTGSVFDRARRISVGCLGLFIGLVTLVVWAAIAFEGQNMVSTEMNEDSTAVTINVGSRRVTLGPPQTGGGEPTEPIELRDARAVRQGVSLYTLQEALDRYVALRREDSPDPMDRELIRALEERFTSEFASDTLRALDDRITELERDARTTRAQLEAAEDELDEAVSGGVVSWLRRRLDDIGFGFGWAALYMTVLLSMTNGQTLGKRLLGIRVLRLDGQSINWWVAFERAGGYAAGFATGLLGFAQVIWDANRQAIHDRIVGTVVIREGAPRIEDWEAAL
jgi:uncharacterized RDD family membrane protein YckC